VVHAHEVARHLANHTAVKLSVAMFVTNQEMNITIGISYDELIGNSRHFRSGFLLQGLLNLLESHSLFVSQANAKRKEAE